MPSISLLEDDDDLEVVATVAAPKKVEGMMIGEEDDDDCIETMPVSKKPSVVNKTKEELHAIAKTYVNQVCAHVNHKRMTLNEEEQYRNAIAFNANTKRKKINPSVLPEPTWPDLVYKLTDEERDDMIEHMNALTKHKNIFFSRDPTTKGFEMLAYAYRMF